MTRRVAIPALEIPSLAVRGSLERFPVRRIFCVGRNYVEHQKEMGGDGREQPFFFAKSAHALVAALEGDCAAIAYPPGTDDYHYETEMVTAIAAGGRDISVERANDHVWGYAVGLDMTRRDLQQQAKDRGRPWTFGKDFDQAAPIGALSPARATGHLASAALRLTVNGQIRQQADIAEMIWSVPEQISYLSRYYTLAAGDLIMTGTPAGVGKVGPGDELFASIEGLAPLRVRIVAGR